TIRLLIPPQSALLASAAIRPHLGALDPAAFTYRWAHPDARMDQLQREVRSLVEKGTAAEEKAGQMFARVRDAAATAAAGAPLRRTVPVSVARLPGRAPRLTEPWFCCAEPTDTQLNTWI